MLKDLHVLALITVDIFVGPDKNTDVYIINQINLDILDFDEPKCMIGYDSLEKAKDTYISAYADGKGLNRIGSIVKVDLDVFKKWLREGDTKRIGEMV